MLRGLCNGAIAMPLRRNFCAALASYKFGNAEHQVVFESVRVLSGPEGSSKRNNYRCI